MEAAGERRDELVTILPSTEVASSGGQREREKLSWRLIASDAWRVSWAVRSQLEDAGSELRAGLLRCGSVCCGHAGGRLGVRRRHCCDSITRSPHHCCADCSWRRLRSWIACQCGERSAWLLGHVATIDRRRIADSPVQAPAAPHGSVGCSAQLTQRSLSSLRRRVGVPQGWRRTLRDAPSQPTRVGSGAV